MSGSAESRKLAQIIAGLVAEGVDYVLVGEDPNQLQQEIVGDVDIVVRSDTLEQISRIMRRVFDQCAVRCVQLFQHEFGAFYYVVAWLEEGDWRYLRIDICADYVRDARPLLSADALLESRQRDDATGYYVPVASRNFVYYLLKKIDKGAVNEEQFEQLCRMVDEEAEAYARAELERFWPAEELESILRIIRVGSFVSFKEKMPRLRMLLRKRCRPTLITMWREAGRIWRRIREPTGIWLVLYGPDGSGKTAVMKDLSAVLMPAFRRAQEYHFRPFVGYPPQDNSIPIADPQGKRPRHAVMSVLKLLYYWADYVGGYWLKIRPGLTCSTLVVFDRYYDDLLVDQKRYRYGGPARLLKIVRRWVPRPHLLFALDADPEILLARKQELAPDECARQRALYRAVVEPLKHGYVIDVSKPLPDVVRSVQTHVLEYMADRMTQRMAIGK